MKIVLLLLALVGPIKSIANECVGHIIFYDLPSYTLESEIYSDYYYYLEKVSGSLKKNGLSHLLYNKIPNRIDTCFGKNISISHLKFEGKLGYIFLMPSGENKVITGVSTGVDLMLSIKDFFHLN